MTELPKSTVQTVVSSMDSVMLPNPFKQYWSKVKKEIQKI